MLNQTTYRLWLRTAINQTGLAANIIQSTVDTLATVAIVANPLDTQD
jgi:hypothetical protein